MEVGTQHESINKEINSYYYYYYSGVCMQVFKKQRPIYIGGGV
jgi:hypothetical protein